MQGPLKGKSALITGGNRGLGFAIAKRLHADGAQVALCARNEASLSQAAEDLGGVDAGVWSFVGDLTDSQKVEEVVADAARAMGGLHIVVNNAGIIARGPVEEILDETWQEVLTTNLTAPFWVCRAALKYIEAQSGGRIVNISSVLGVFGVPEAAAYVATKHGLLGFTRTAALELASRGITVNAICPGWTRSDMTDQGIEDLAKSWGMDAEKGRKKIASELPLGRILDPSEVAAAVSYLCSEEAAGVTAQALRVDGGQTPF